MVGGIINISIPFYLVQQFRFVVNIYFYCIKMHVYLAYAIEVLRKLVRGILWPLKEKYVVKLCFHKFQFLHKLQPVLL